MGTAAYSLRSLVDKWLAPTQRKPAHLVQIGRTQVSRSRFVRFAGQTSVGFVTIVFFRHDDGSWCVFPPRGKVPAMRQIRSDR
ncbi:hypothetical protein LMG28688_06056 [Paraburkholderia caffeinitolerans]|uniref:Uncharacterized protein n=1 Tax=Paraburkholderia caffeinitolerans TaxID=1723730 RepID=A0A6J5GSM9_9BURK|nr:hypothetical protein [Paraburkholderia caffeinitolerans]CAB3804718.1 hypothetical protein LMG28688_06056 [Paraburkholderia caffeinitolerans]